MSRSASDANSASDSDFSDVGCVSNVCSESPFMTHIGRGSDGKGMSFLARSFENTHVVCSALGVRYGLSASGALHDVLLGVLAVVVVPMGVEIVWMHHWASINCPHRPGCSWDHPEALMFPMHIITAIICSIALTVWAFANLRLQRRHFHHKEEQDESMLMEDWTMDDLFLPGSFEELAMDERTLRRRRKSSLTSLFVRCVGFSVLFSFMTWLPFWLMQRALFNDLTFCFKAKADQAPSTLVAMLNCSAQSVEDPDSRDEFLALTQQRLAAKWWRLEVMGSHLVLPFFFGAIEMHGMANSEAFGCLFAAMYIIARLGMVRQGRKSLYLQDLMETRIVQQEVEEDEYAPRVRRRDADRDSSLREVVQLWRRLDELFVPRQSLRTTPTCTLVTWAAVSVFVATFLFILPGLIRTSGLSRPPQPFLTSKTPFQAPIFIGGLVMALVHADFVFFSCYSLNSYRLGVLRMKVLRSTWHLPTFNLLVRQAKRAVQTHREDILSAYYFLDLTGTPALGNLYAWKLTEAVLSENMMRARIRVEALVVIGIIGLVSTTGIELLLMLLGETVSLTMTLQFFLSALIVSFPVIKAILVCVELNYMRYQNVSCLMTYRESLLMPAGGSALQEFSSNLSQWIGDRERIRVDLPVSRRPSLAGTRYMLEFSDLQSILDHPNGFPVDKLGLALATKSFQDISLLRYATCLDGIISLKSHRSTTHRLVGIPFDVMTARKFIVVFVGCIVSNAWQMMRKLFQYDGFG